MATRNFTACFLISLFVVQSATLMAQAPPQFRPNDPVIDEMVAAQLSLFEIYAFERSAQPVQNEVVLAVLDGPIAYNHAEFLGRLYPPVNLTMDSTYEADDPHEFNHGSFNASPALAITNNGIGVTSAGGLSGNIKGQGFKAHAADGSTVSLGTALQAVLDQRARGINIRVITVGWVSTVPDITGLTDQALDQLAAQGVVLVCPVRSQVTPVNLDENCNDWPACYAKTHWNVIPVAPLQADGMTLSSVSNFGASVVQFAAPGTNVKVVGFLGNNSSTSFSGPTPAASLVAGSLLLVELYRQPDARLAIQLLKDGASRLASLEGKVKDGRRVNPFRALLPIIVSNPDGTALTLESVTQKTGPFKVGGEFLFASDNVSRIILNVQNITLLPGEGPSAVAVEAVDSQGNHIFLPVEAVAPLAEASHYTQVVIRLSANKPGETIFPELATGSVSLTLTYHQQVSNTVVIQVVR